MWVFSFELFVLKWQYWGVLLWFSLYLGMIFHFPHFNWEHYRYWSLTINKYIAPSYCIDPHKATKPLNPHVFRTISWVSLFLFCEHLYSVWLLKCIWALGYIPGCLWYQKLHALILKWKSICWMHGGSFKHIWIWLLFIISESPLNYVVLWLSRVVLRGHGEELKDWKCWVNCMVSMGKPWDYWDDWWHQVDLNLHCYCLRVKGLQLCTFPTTKQKIKRLMSEAWLCFCVKLAHFLLIRFIIDICFQPE